MRHRLIIVAVLALTRAAAAQTEVPPAQREIARQHFTAGVNFIDQGRWQQAIEELDQARAIAPTAAVFYNLGLAYRGVGRQRLAISSFREFLRSAGDRIDPARRTEVEHFITELTTSMGRLWLRVNVSNPSVTLDGENVVPGEFDVDSGRHTLVVSASGYSVETRSVNIPSGGRESLLVELTREVRQSHLQIVPEPLASDIFVDETRVGSGSVDVPVTEGRHRVEVRAQGYTTLHEDINVSAGADLRMNARLQLVPRTQGGGILSNPIFWTVTGVVVAGLVVGGVLLFAEQPIQQASWGTITTGFSVAF